MSSDLTRPIIGIENRTAQEVFDIMCDRLRRSASPSIGRVGVKALVWKESGLGFHNAETPFGTYSVMPPFNAWKPVKWCMRGENFDREAGTIIGAKAAAQADYEARIRSALVYHEEPAGDTQGAGEDDAEPTWRDLALQFDGQRIEALSLLRYVSEARNCAEATGRAAEIRPFLAKAPLSGEAVLAARLAALVSPPDNGGWMPIDTAPKDREILLAGRYDRSGFWDIRIGSWVAHREAWPYVGQRYPSLWQPLPSPPALQSHNEGSAGLDACFECHSYIDTGHGTKPLLTEAEFYWHLLRGVVLTMLDRARRQIIIVPLDPEHLSSSKPTPKRKPPEQRTKIPARVDAWPTGRKLVSRNTLRKARK